MPEPLESGDEVFIEDGYFTIKDHSGFWESANHPGEFTKSPCVIPTIPAVELDLAISLESQDSPSVVLFFVHPSLRWKGRGMRVGCMRVMLEGKATFQVYRGRNRQAHQAR